MVRIELCREQCMLRWVVIFFVLAIFAGVFGFTDIAGAAAGISRQKPGLRISDVTKGRQSSVLCLARSEPALSVGNRMEFCVQGLEADAEFARSSCLVSSERLECAQYCALLKLF